ncbi:MAG: C-GCAxxG-C-C family protein [Clostridia bacterium]|nr:C-GCAxxG-C-C family protein [Clostridia bacterium]
MSHEKQAREYHRRRLNCAMSVFTAFAGEMGLTMEEAMQQAPKPRSEGGRCGAFLAGRSVLERLRPEAVPAYEEGFVGLNGMTECRALVAAHGILRKSCNDYVGDAARLVEELLR